MNGLRRVASRRAVRFFLPLSAAIPATGRRQVEGITRRLVFLAEKKGTLQSTTGLTHVKKEREKKMSMGRPKCYTGR